MDWEFIFSVSLTTAFGPQAVVFALAAIGLNVHFGYTGLVNFGQVGFLAVGAYTVAMGVRHLRAVVLAVRVPQLLHRHRSLR